MQIVPQQDWIAGLSSGKQAWLFKVRKQINSGKIRFSVPILGRMNGCVIATKTLAVGDRAIVVDVIEMSCFNPPSINKRINKHQ